MRARPHSAERENMEILNKSEGITERKAYKLTHDGECREVQKSAGAQFDVTAFIHFIKPDKDNNDREHLIMITEDGESFVTQSPSVIRSFFDMMDTFGLPLKDVEIVKETNKKNGREFFNLVLVDD